MYTVGRPSIVRKKPKISDQMDEPFWRYSRYKYRYVVDQRPSKLYRAVPR